MTTRNGNSPCELQLTRREARLLMVAAGSRLQHLLHARASSAITGPELDQRIEWWRKLIHKIDVCLSAEDDE
jgi:hypothetical protein